MAKPNTIGGYNNAVTEACERVLVTLLRKLGPWRDSIFLVGGLAPRYLIKARPPDVPAHAGTGDVDVVVDIAMLSDTEAYQTLEENLHAMNFERATNDKGAKQSWRWKAALDGGIMILEFLADDPDLRGGKVQELPTKGGVSAVNIPNASMVFDHHEQIEITAELLDGGGRATETVRYADIVSFTCLKAFAFDERFERKDAHDIVYCLEHIDGGVEAALERFKRALDGNYRDVILDALSRLHRRFCDPDSPSEAYRRDGPVAVARFEDGDVPIEDTDAQDQRVLRQRRAADIVGALVVPLLDRPADPNEELAKQ
jgi:hypothetical protein